MADSDQERSDQDPSSQERSNEERSNEEHSNEESWNQESLNDESSGKEHLLNQLRDAHAVEVQALRQLERAARASDDDSAQVYEEHFEQSHEHEQKVRELVEARGHEPSPIEDKTLRGGGIGLRQLADVALDTPVKTTMNLYALEHLEIATYALLAETARGLDDEEVAKEAERLREEEEAAAEKLEGTFDRAVELLLERAREGDGSSDADGREEDEDSRDADGDSSDEGPEAGLLLAHLRDLHALEEQSLALLRIGVDELAGDDELEGIYREHLEQSEDHEQMVKDQIEKHEAKPSAVRDLHMGAATASLRDLSEGPPDAQAKLAVNVFCVEHLEIAAYELLARLAKQCGDDDAVQMAEKILEQERATAEALGNSFGHIAQLTLESDGSYATVRAAETAE
jgi:ferritin-like metal-binding protein YciE